MASLAYLLYERSDELLALLPRASKFELYKYTPSLAAAVLFIVLFALTTSLHSYQMFRTRTWFYIPFLLGGLCTYKPLSVAALPGLRRCCYLAT